jgi:outer membrane protein assembly factor BamD (BamD/ComL family)
LAETAGPPGTGPGRAAGAAVPAAAEDWLEDAREEYHAGRSAGALGALDQFMLRFPGGSDEAFWLYGQSYEANNETTRDIRRALDYYRRLTGEYPQSVRYDDARRRIVYLERFYFNIR